MPNPNSVPRPNSPLPALLRRHRLVLAVSALLLGVPFHSHVEAQTFPASIDLGSLNGTNGFRLDGSAAGDYSGFSVSAAGDVNGDGLDDLIIGALAASLSAPSSGSSYVVFGTRGGFPSAIALSGLDGSNGFRLDGEAAGDTSGFSVSYAGDVNNDGLADLIIGAPNADPNVNQSGASYVVFGRSNGFAATLALSSLDGSSGFRLDGAMAEDRSGSSVGAAGDFNGDGIDDVIVGAPLADPNGNISGSSYVVFGRSSGFAATLALFSLDGSIGFRLDGTTMNDQSGSSVGAAGDINDDGIDDVVVGTPFASPNGFNSGSIFVVFGRSSGIAATQSLADLDGSNGFRLDGAAMNNLLGASVGAAGDVNGDGIDDLIVGAFGSDANGIASGSSYVVYGRSGGFPSTIALSSIDGSNGFRIDGVEASDRSGFAVAGAGDVNGDGIGDVLIGTFDVDPASSNSGHSYVVFGRLGGFPAAVSLADLDGHNGFQLVAEPAASRSRHSLSAAGDVNGDGLDDVIVGASNADPNGDFSGSSYVVFGRDTTRFFSDGFEAPPVR